jgi:hypothetical protein
MWKELPLGENHRDHVKDSLTTRGQLGRVGSKMWILRTTKTKQNPLRSVLARLITRDLGSFLTISPPSDRQQKPQVEENLQPSRTSCPILLSSLPNCLPCVVCHLIVFCSLVVSGLGVLSSQGTLSQFFLCCCFGILQTYSIMPWIQEEPLWIPYEIHAKASLPAWLCLGSGLCPLGWEWPCAWPGHKLTTV